jgi:hypothetical protein
MLLLASAALVLLGGWIELYRGGAPSSSVFAMLGWQLLYQALLLGTFAYLVRVRRTPAPARPLFGLLVLFVLDGSLVQHRFGWDPGEGQGVAALGIVLSLVTAAALFRVAGLPLAGRLFLALFASAAVSRLGPILIAGAIPPQVGLSSPWVLQGWFLSLVLLPFVLPGRRYEPDPRESSVAAAALGFGVLHFAIAGIGAGLPLRPAYLAPLLVLLGPALDRLLREEEKIPERRLVIRLIPWIGLAAAAFDVTPELFGAGTGWSVTPFSTVLVLVIALRHFGLLPREPRGAVAVDAALFSSAILGGDLPEVLVRLRFPEAWQLVVVTAIVGLALRRSRERIEISALPLLPALLAAGWISETLRIPWVAALATTVAGSLLVSARLGGIPVAGPLAPKLLAGVLAFAPLAAFALAESPDTALALAVWLLLLVPASERFALPLLRRAAALAGAVAVVGLALSASPGIDLGSVEPARLMVAAGFFLFFAGLATVLFGARVAALIRRRISVAP